MNAKLFALSVIFLIFSFYNNSFGQCPAGQVEASLTTGGGGFDNELWVSITDGANGTGTILWAQGNGTIGNGSGALTAETFCLPEGVDLFINTYDQYDDSWNGATYTLTIEGVVVASNNGNSPDDGLNSDATGGWDQSSDEIEVSEQFSTNIPVDITSVTDICNNDTPIDVLPITDATPASGFSGIAVILVTDGFASETTFDLYDLEGNIISTETSFPGAPATLSNNTVYVVYDNPCFPVNQTAGIPDEMDLFDSASDGIFENGGSGLYVYYYPGDGVEVISNDRNNDGVNNYIAPGTGGFPSFYSAASHRRTNCIQFDDGATTVIFPAPADYEYISAGSWNGTGITNTETISKTYFAGFPGLSSTITVPNGNAQFDPSTAPVGPNNGLSFTYNSVLGINGPAPCNTATTTNTELDVHANPIASVVHDQTCDGATYDVTVDINLGTYNVSVDEDGATPFDVSGTGGTVSHTTLTGTGVTQVTISNIPSGDSWSLDVEDNSTLACGLINLNGNCITVLPIELLSFTGKKKGKTNQLFWTTTSERNNDYFVIEKCHNAIDFVEIPEYIDGAGNSTEILDYSKTDNNPYSRTYYRLRQVDFNGDYSYSNIIVIENNSSDAYFVDVFPNPTNNELNISLTSAKNVFASYELIDLSGKVYQNGELNFSQKSSKQTIQMSSLSSGVYILSVNIDGQVIREKITKR